MIVVLLPAYNEGLSLVPLLTKIENVMKKLSLEYKIIICNDGSCDNTSEILAKYSKNMPLEIIHHKFNRGLGETIRDLFERASEICKPDDIIVRMDCDNTHEPEIIADMITKLNEGFDVVIASRFQPGGGQIGLGTYRTFISRAANIFMKIFFPIKGVWDYSCGFRAYRAKIIQKAIDFYKNDFIQLKGLGFTCTLEKLIKLKILGARFAEVPFVLRYDQKQSDSKMLSSITTLGYLVMTLLYHWPWGGWRRSYKAKLKEKNVKKNQ
ncbi:MAG TPA: glycosyltransferase [Candidatus Desulfofervidus auxilii]|uniref:Glycosyltransferase n=1 Tax=Desulfofervidus auxilii TaxID=1621989 RepID=A0A7C0Y2I7_DESA2|nr:glycosyltransferase [Candidatus Desulfofervidus auxilii]